MKPFPRISTRGFYNLYNGDTLSAEPYHLFPKSFFDSIMGIKEITIMMHGLRNDSAGALDKFVIAQRRLRRVGYRYPVIGYSYDSNTRGAHLDRYAARAQRVGQRIARKNGRNLARFMQDFNRKSPDTSIRLMGHSLGSKVILHAAEALSRSSRRAPMIESIHLFGASVTAGEIYSEKYSKILQCIVRTKIVNHYSPDDDILKDAHESGDVPSPIGYLGCRPKPLAKYTQKRVNPKNHRFASYAATIRSFP